MNPFDGVKNTTKRITSPWLESLIGKKFPVLDDGWLYVVDYMGDESSVVQAARTSYGKGTKKVQEDIGLIRYLLRNRHSTPVEMCTLKLHVRVPMDAWRQWIRHRTFSVNEYSTRYSEAIDSRQTTKPDQWRLQGLGNRQGSSGVVTGWPDGEVVGQNASEGETAGEYLSYREKWLHEQTTAIYEERLRFGVAREVARKDLPLSTYTEAYWCGNLNNLLHFLGLRMDSHAQKEIRDYADVVGKEIVAGWLPNLWKAFNCYHPLRDAENMSSLDMGAIAAYNARQRSPDEPAVVLLKDLPEEWVSVGKKKGKLIRNRERDEFIAKANRLGLKCFFTRPDGTPVDFSPGNNVKDFIAADLASGGVDEPWGDHYHNGTKLPT